MVAVSVENACVLCFCMKSCKSTLHVEVFPTASEFRLSKCGSQQLLKSTPLLLSFLSKRVSTKSCSLTTGFIFELVYKTSYANVEKDVTDIHGIIFPPQNCVNNIFETFDGLAWEKMDLLEPILFSKKSNEKKRS